MSLPFSNEKMAPDLRPAWNAAMQFEPIEINEGFDGVILEDEEGYQKLFSVVINAKKSYEMGQKIEKQAPNVKGVGAGEILVGKRKSQAFKEIYSIELPDSELIELIGVTAVNYNIGPTGINSFLALWEPECGFTLGHGGYSSLGVQLNKLPEDMEMFCNACYYFCPDIFYFDHPSEKPYEVKLLGPKSVLKKSERLEPDSVSWFAKYLQNENLFLEFGWD